MPESRRPVDQARARRWKHDRHPSGRFKRRFGHDVTACLSRHEGDATCITHTLGRRQGGKVANLQGSHPGQGSNLVLDRGLICARPIARGKIYRVFREGGRGKIRIAIQPRTNRKLPIIY
jgi:hypothetical protein